MRSRPVEAEVPVTLHLRALQRPDDPSTGYRPAQEDVEILNVNEQPARGRTGRIVDLLDWAFPGWRDGAVWQDTGAIEKADRDENRVEGE